MKSVKKSSEKRKEEREIIEAEINEIIEILNSHRRLRKQAGLPCTEPMIKLDLPQARIKPQSAETADAFIRKQVSAIVSKAIKVLNEKKPAAVQEELPGKRTRPVRAVVSKRLAKKAAMQQTTLKFGVDHSVAIDSPK